MTARNRRRLASTQRQDARLRLRQGVVAAVNTDGTVDVTVAGDDVVVADVALLGPAGPGQGIWLLQLGADLLALGTPGGTGRGILDQATQTSSQGGIGANTQLTGLSVSAVLRTGRLYRVAGACSVTNGTATGSQGVLRIREGATAKAFGYTPDIGSTSRTYRAAAEVLIPGNGAAHTYDLWLERLGSGTLASAASATDPAFVAIEDVGPARG